MIGRRTRDKPDRVTLTVNGREYWAGGVTVTLAGDALTSEAVRRAEELIRVLTGRAPYKSRDRRDGTQVIGTTAQKLARPPAGPSPVQDIHSTWVCMVRETGFENGPGCTDKEPHTGWSCGWHWRVLIPAPGPGLRKEI